MSGRQSLKDEGLTAHQLFRSVGVTMGSRDFVLDFGCENLRIVRIPSTRKLGIIASFHYLIIHAGAALMLFRKH